MMKVFLGLGTNLGNRVENLRKALNKIETDIGPMLKTSSLYETEPWGFKSTDMFLNVVVMLETELAPPALMAKILFVETLLGRQREENHYVSRIIDIDILLYEDLIIEAENLTIPHPLMHERRFVLEPLCEIEPDLVHPVFGVSVRELLSRCNDTSKIQRFKIH